MLKEQYDFEELQMSSRLVRDLIDEKASVEPLVNHFFDPDQIEEQINDKAYSTEFRTVLADRLAAQNNFIELSERAQENLTLLKEGTTFTITVGHQLNLLTGPLYSIYKVAQAIALAEELKEKYPHYNFVPIFWMATEDHDFEEINHIHLFNQKISWDKEGQEDLITGRIDTASIEDFLDPIEEKFKDPKALEVVKKFTDIYRNTNNLADACRRLMNLFFGDQGLLIIDGDDKALKQLMIPVFTKEIAEELTIQKVSETNDYLENKGYHQQVYVRTCNLFFITEKGKRIRIQKEDNQFKIEDRTFSQEEMLEMVQKNPHQFSPNALLRPVYQELILPNLVFVGGGGELAYWLQLKAVFEANNITFPMLRLRDSILIYNQKEKELLDRLNIDLLDVKIGVHDIVKELAIQESDADLQLTDAESSLLTAKSKVMEKVHSVNSSLEPMVEAEFTKMVKSIERIESKLIKAEKSKHERTQKDLMKTRDHFFPENGFQERYENFLFYYIKDHDFVPKILSILTADKKPKIRLIEI